MRGLTLFWIRRDTRYEDINNNRTDVELERVEEITYADPMAYAIDLSKVRDLESRLNKEIVFTEKSLAYESAARKNIEICNEILALCEESKKGD